MEYSRIATSPEDLVVCGNTLEKFKPEEAARCFEAAYKLNPNIPKTIVFRAKFRLGLVDSNSPHRKEALNAYLQEMERAAELNPTAPVINYVEVAKRRIELNKLDEALMDIERGLAHNPSLSVSLYQMKAIILQSQKKLDLALTAADIAVSFEPNNPMSLMTKAGVLTSLKREEEALKCLDKAIECPTPLEESIQIDRGDCLVELGRDEEALAIFSKYNRYERMASVHLDRIDHKTALKFADQAITANPGSIVAIHCKAFCLAALGEDAQSKQLLEKLSLIIPSSATPYVLYGDLHTRAGEYQ